MRKKLMLSALSFLTVLLIVTACEKNDDLPPIGNIKAFFEQQIKNKTQTFILDASIGGTIVGSDGTRITFPANSFFPTNSFTPLQGNVTVSLVEAYTKSDMLLVDMPTVAIDAQGEFLSLASGGEFGLKAMQNDTDVTIRALLSVQTAPNAVFDSAMRLFTADTTVNRPALPPLDVWQIDNNVNLQMCGGTSVGTYCFNFWAVTRKNAWIWLNCDKPIFVSNPPSLQVKLPKKYQSTNAVVRCTVETINGLFPLHLGNDNFFKPLNLNIKNMNINVLALADDGGTLKYALKPHYFSSDATITFEENDFQTTDAQALKTILDNLP